MTSTNQVIHFVSEVARREGYADQAATGIIVRLENPYTKKYLITVDGTKKVAFAIADEVYQEGAEVRVLVPRSESDQDYVILNKILADNVQSAMSNDDRFTDILQIVKQKEAFQFSNGTILFDKLNEAEWQSTAAQLASANLRVIFDFDAYSSENKVLAYTTKYGFKITVSYLADSGLESTVFTIDENMIPGHPFYTGNLESRTVDLVFEIPNSDKFADIEIQPLAAEIEADGVVKISNMVIYLVEGKVIEDKNTYSIAAPLGKTLNADVNVYLQGTMRDRGALVQSGVTYYWFRKNPLVVKDSLGYSPLAGEGWELVYTGNDPIAAEDSNLETKEE